jgi:spore coat protein U-like protein
MMTRWIVAVLLAMSFGFATGPAFAQSCNFSISTVNFGTINLAANTTFTTAASFQASCTGTANTTVRTCPNINVGSGGSTSGNPRFLINGGTQLNFNLYQDGGYSTVWGSNLWAFAGSYPSPTLDIPLNGSGTGSGSLTLYGQIWSGQPTLPAGTYTSSFSGTQSSVAYAYSTVGTCPTIGNSNATSTAFMVTANNSATCAVSASNLNFGSAGVLQSSVDGTSTVSITCTNSTPYTVSPDGGLSQATNPTQRLMTKGSEQITYGLYQDTGRTQPWGNSTGTNTVAGTGSGLSQNATVYGRVPAQNTPSPGTYTDTVVVTVTY